MTEDSERHANVTWPHGEFESARAADPWAASGPVLPHPATPYPASTRWTDGTERGRAESADGLSPWAPADPPGSVPDPIPGTFGPHTAAGWLTRGRDAGD